MKTTIKQNVQKFRKEGKTFSEIQRDLKIKVPKSTLSGWCKGLVLPKEYSLKIINLNKQNLNKARKLAWKMNKERRELYVSSVKKNLAPLAELMKDKNISKLFLTALYLGEGRKGSKNRQLTLGNSDPRIIKVFLKLLKNLYSFDLSKVRCTVQARADQNLKYLENYWMEVTKIPKEQFYKTRVDLRTLGKPTVKQEYKGVLRIDYFDTKIHLELEILANLVSEYLIYSLGR